MTTTLDEIRRLSIAERIQLVEDIWDSIATSSQPLELTQAQQEELDARLLEHRHEPNAGSSWDEVKQRITGQA